MANQSSQRDAFSVLSLLYSELGIRDDFSEADSFRLSDGTKLFYLGFLDGLLLGTVPRVLVFGLNPPSPRQAFPRTGMPTLLALEPDLGKVQALEVVSNDRSERSVVLRLAGEPVIF